MKLTSLLLGILTVGCIGSMAQAETAKVQLGSTSTSTVSGTVILSDSAEGLKIDAEVTGAPAGNHAFHIHEFGACDDQAKAAGSHYNPAGHPHGNTLKDGVAKTHAGDFGSITVDKFGKGTLHAVVPGLTLTKGETAVAGRSFVLHEKPDDFSQPTGNAGGRIACGPIVITGK